MNENGSAFPQIERAQRWAILAGVIALVATGAGAFFFPLQFMQSYLFAFILFLQIALGCLGLLMLHHLVGGSWGLVIERVLEAGALTIPLLAVLFIPILLRMQDLYSWTGTEAITQSDLHNKEQYLQVPSFVLRSVLYFAVWSALAWMLTRWSRSFDQTRDQKYARRVQMLSGPGLVLFVLSVTFATIDWVMSLEPEWYTTAYGFIMVSAQALSAMAFCIVILSLLRKFKPLSDVVEPSHFHDLGNLLLAFLMFWTYCAFSQYLILWSGNIPEEVAWYAHRAHGGWIYFAFVLIFAHFLFPFLLLLSRRVKQHSRTLAALAAAILFFRAVDTYWLILPAFYPERFTPHWLHVAMPIAIGALWLIAFLTILKRRPLLPRTVQREEITPLPLLEAS